MNHPNQLTKAGEVKAFCLAGNAAVTLVSQRSGQRFTYKVRKGDDTQPQQQGKWYVSILTGPDKWTFLGRIQDGGQLYKHTTTHLGPGTPGSKVFYWFWMQILQQRLHPGLEVWHEGRCGRCGRALTVPSSIANGIGPECQQRMEGDGLLRQVGLI